MTTFAANAGNILQHAPLCAAVSALAGGADASTGSLLLLDAHAMAQLALARKAPTPAFVAFHRTLRASRSEYAKAWLTLTRDADRYPSTANFVAALWKDELQMTLCERDGPTANAIDAWSKTLGVERRTAVTLWRGDWRSRFASGFEETCDFTIVSFDPYAFHRRGATRNLGNMWPDDIALLASATRSFGRGVLTQISTYSTNDDNSADDVRTCWGTCFEQSGFRPLITLVSKKRGMMTAFFGKGRWPASRIVAAIRGCVSELNSGLGDQITATDWSSFV
jgi:hypothetical protein